MVSMFTLNGKLFHFRVFRKANTDMNGRRSGRKRKIIGVESRNECKRESMARKVEAGALKTQSEKISLHGRCFNQQNTRKKWGVYDFMVNTQRNTHTHTTTHKHTHIHTHTSTGTHTHTQPHTHTPKHSENM